MSLFRAAILIAIATFLLFVVTFMPASLVWLLAGDRVPPQIIVATHIEGTPWRGSATVSGQFIPTGELEWDLHVADLLRATVTADLLMHGPAHHLSATTRWDGARLAVEGLSGWVDADAVNFKVEPLGYQVSGTLDLADLNGAAENNWFTSLGGRMAWTGGKLSYTSARSNLLYHLPALRGALRLNGDAVEILVEEPASDQRGPQPLLDLNMTPDGWARVSMRGRLFDLVEQPRPMAGAADEVVMQLEAQLWRP